MGSFNLKCSVSNQVIKPGDPCWIIPLRPSTCLNSFVLKNSEGVLLRHPGNYFENKGASFLWKPVGPLFKGKYADYGLFNLEAFEKTQGVQKSLLESFFKDISSRALSSKMENRGGDFLSFEKIYKQGVTYSTAEWESIWEHFCKNINEGLLFVQEEDLPCAQVKLAVIRQDCAKELISLVEVEKQMDLYEYFKNFVVNKMKQKKSLYRLELSSDLDGFPIGGGQGVNYIRNYPSVLSLGSFISDQESDLLSQEGLKKEFFEKVFELKKAEIEFRFLIEGLCKVGVALAPVQTAGQDFDNETGSRFAKLVSKINSCS